MVRYFFLIGELVAFIFRSQKSSKIKNINFISILDKLHKKYGICPKNATFAFNFIQTYLLVV